MVHEQDRVAVGDQVVHHARQPFQVRRVESDGRLVEDVQHARRPVPDRPGELHALALAGGERRGGTVERKIREPKFHQPTRRVVERLADPLRHRTHRLGQGRGNAAYPVLRLGQRHLARLVERDPAQKRRAGAFGEARAAAVGTRPLLQELCDALHALLVLHVLERVLHGVDGVEEREVHLA